MRTKKFLGLFLTLAMLVSCMTVPVCADSELTLESSVKGMPSVKTVYTDDNFDDRTISEDTTAESTTESTKISSTAKSNFKQEPDGNIYVTMPQWGTVKTKVKEGQDIDRLTVAFRIANRSDTEDLYASVQIFGTGFFRVKSFKSSNKVTLQECSAWRYMTLEDKGTAVTESDGTTTYWHDVAVTLCRKDGVAYFDEIILDGEKIETFSTGKNVNEVATITDKNWWTTVSGSSMVAIGNSSAAGNCFDDVVIYEQGTVESGSDEDPDETDTTLESSIAGMPEAKTVYTDDTFEDRTITDSTSTGTAAGDKKIAVTILSNYKQETSGNKYINLLSYRTAKTKLINGQDVDKLTIAFKVANRSETDELYTSARIFGITHFRLNTFKDSNKITFQECIGWRTISLEGKGTAVTNSDETTTYWHDVAVTLCRKDGVIYFDEVVLDGEKIETFANGKKISEVATNTTTNWWTTVSGSSMVEVGNSSASGICFDDFAVYEPVSESEVSVFRCKKLLISGDLKSEASLSASALMKNTTEEDEDVMLVAAVYKQNDNGDALYKVTCKNVTIPAGTVELSISTDDLSVGELSDTDKYYAKAYLWSDMIPVCESAPYREDVNIVLMGDSICQTYTAAAYPQEGWGTYIGDYFDSSYATVQNKAYGGYTTKSYMDANGWGNEGGWTGIKQTLRCGDYIILSLGINDKASSSITVDDFKNNLKTIGNEASEMGVEVIYVTPIISARVNSEGRFVRTHGTYADAMIDVANELNCTVLDLSTEMCDALNARLDNGEDVETIQGEIFMYYLVQNGILTEEQAANHPNSNVSKYDETTGTYGNDSHLQQTGAQYVTNLICGLLEESNSSLKGYLQ